MVICLAQLNVVFPTIHQWINQTSDRDMSQLRDIIIRPRVQPDVRFRRWNGRTTHETVPGYSGSEQVAHDALSAALAVVMIR